MAAITVSSPETTMERLLMAPVTSPIVMAFAVPMAWDALPMPMPCAIGSSMRKSFKIISAKILPNKPVNTMAATVIGTMPPISSESPMPMAVVIDFGRNAIYSSWDSLKSIQIPRTLKVLESTPEVIPRRRAFQFFFKVSNCSYKGSARQMVAGVKR